MKEEITAWLLATTRAARVTRWERIQSLWSGYGELLRVHLDGSERETVIVKWVHPPAAGARSDVSHRRKCRSYDVELAFYRVYASRCDDGSRVAEHLGQRTGSAEWLLALEDLDALGFDRRLRDPRGADLDACLVWLARFHGRFLGVRPESLWTEGTYWHLDTRREELAAIRDARVRAGAPELDRRLREARWRTIVHGDAKPANFCFARGARGVAAVDFQYVGGGCGMRDVAYLLEGTGSSIERRGLDLYFDHLRAALDPGADAAALEEEWRALYPVAAEDFRRFLAGWRG